MGHIVEGSEYGGVFRRGVHSAGADVDACHTEPVRQGAPWAFIAVMGVTGAGKSTFIREVSGDDNVVVGNGLKSCSCYLHA